MDYYEIWYKHSCPLELNSNSGNPFSTIQFLFLQYCGFWPDICKTNNIHICFNCTQCLMIITKGLHANMLNWDNNCDNQYTSHHTPQTIYPAVILVLSFVKYESWVKATSRITLLYFRHLLEQACFASTNSNGICTPIHSGSLPQFSWLSFIIGPSAQAAQTEQ